MDLCRIPDLDATRARKLWKAGFRSVHAIANAPSRQIYELSIADKPFNKENRELEQRIAHSIVSAAKEILENDRKELESAVRNLALPNERTTKVSNNVAQEMEDYSAFESEALKLDSADFRIVRTDSNKECLDLFLRTLLARDEFAFRLSGLDSESLSFTGMAVSWSVDTVFYFTLDGVKKLGGMERVLEAFRQTRKSCMNAKLHYKALLSEGFEIEAGSLFDPCVASWVMDPDSGEKSLEQLVEKYTPIEASSFTADAMETCCRDAIKISKLMRYLNEALTREGLLQYFETIEMPIAKVTAKMEIVGVGFAKDVFLNHWDRFTRLLECLEEQAYALAGQRFNLCSPAEVSKILYDKLGIPYPDGAGEGKMRSTNKETLKRVYDAHEIVPILMKHRSASAFVSSHLLPLAKGKKWSESMMMERVSPTFYGFTATGRITTHSPNLQNIPHANPIFEFDKNDITPSSIRNVICTKGKDCVLLSLDYCQLELRIIAHLSGEEKLVRVFRDNQRDPFDAMAEEWFGAPVTFEKRKRAKAISYSVMYGVGAHSLAEDLDVEPPAAVDFINQFHARYPACLRYQEKVVQQCRDHGYVQTMFGRKRYLQDIHARQISRRLHAERQAFSMTCYS